MKPTSTHTRRGITRRGVTRRLGLTTAGVLASPLSLQSAGAAGWAATPAQTEGPFYPATKQAELDADLTLVAGAPGRAAGEVIVVSGRVTDTRGQPLVSSLVDIWQANHHGRYRHPDDRNPAPLDPGFQGWAMVKTDADGRYRFKTIKPGAYLTSPEGPQRCRHIHFKVIDPGFPELTTQMYFPGDPLIADDLVMRETPPVERGRLIARAVDDPSHGLPTYHFDITLSA